MKVPIYAKVLYIILWVFFVLAIGIFLCLPAVVKFVYNPAYLSNHKAVIMGFLYLLVLCGIWILGELVRIVKTIKSNPFVPRNRNALTRIGIVCVLAAGLFLLKIILLFSYSTLLCIIIFVIASLVVFTISNLFNQALLYKQENDLTI